MAEAEDHLRETTAAGLATGMTEREAQQAAISAFGPCARSSARTVRQPWSRADARRRDGDLCLAALEGRAPADRGRRQRLGRLIMNATLGRAFTGQPPAGVSFQRADCASGSPCGRARTPVPQARMLEASSDAVPAGRGRDDGVALPVAYGVVRYVSGGAGGGRWWCSPATSRRSRRASSAPARSAWPSPGSPASRSPADPAHISGAFVAARNGLARP